MAFTGFREIDPEVTHDLFNDIRAHSIVLRQSITFDGRQFAGSDARRVGSDARFILDISLGKLAKAGQRILARKRQGIEAAL